MALSNWISVLMPLFLLTHLSEALDITFCSPDNTGSSFQPVQNIYQSHGACHDTCSSNYAFAILQDKRCWCSNYAPAYGVDPMSCDDPCPGFGSEWCGSLSHGLYAYLPLTLLPSGTSARSSAQPSTTPGSSTTPKSMEQPSTIDTTTPMTSTTSASITSSFSATQPPSLVPWVITVTQNGTTITSTASVSPSPDPAVGQLPPAPSGSNTGRMAGIVIGTAVGVLAVVGLLSWLCVQRRRRRQAPAGMPDSDHFDGSRGLPTRHASQMSQAGLIDKNPRIITTGLPMGPNANSAVTTLSQSNRYSVGTDMRLNPNAIYTREESRQSNVSLQDNCDYSRQLQVRNPDS